MKRGSRALLVLAAWSLGVPALGACGGGETHPPAHDDPPATATTATPPSTGAAPSPHPTTVQAIDRAPATLVHLTGVARGASGPLAQDASLDHGDRVELEAGAEATIELEEGDRITLFGPCIARIGQVGSASMELARGVAHVRLPPGPAGPRAPLRVATSETTLELIGPGEVLVDASPSGVTWTVVMSGLTHLAGGEADAHHHPRVTEVAGGRAVLYGADASEPTDAPVRLEEARAAATVLLGTTSPLEPARRADRVRHAATDLDTALGWLEAEARHGHDLTDQHRAAVAAGQSDEAMRLQGALVGHAQELHALRDTARLRWERLSVMALDGAVPSGEPDPVAPRRDRAVSLLGLE